MLVFGNIVKRPHELVNDVGPSRSQRQERPGDLAEDVTTILNTEEVGGDDDAAETNILSDVVATAVSAGAYVAQAAAGMAATAAGDYAIRRVTRALGRRRRTPSWGMVNGPIPFVSPGTRWVPYDVAPRMSLAELRSEYDNVMGPDQHPLFGHLATDIYGPGGPPLPYAPDVELDAEDFYDIL